MKRFFTSLVVLFPLFFLNNLSAQVINTIVGGIGDYGAATAAVLSSNNIAVDRLGNLFIGDAANGLVRKVSAGGVITTYARVNASGLAVDTSGNLFVSSSNGKIYKVNTSGVLSLYAGNNSGTPADGVPATAAWLNGPAGITTDRSGNLYIAEYYGNRVRKINTAGIIATIAGTGAAGSTGDGGPATAAKLNGPKYVCRDTSGNIYISEYSNNKIRKIDTSGIITTFAGSGIYGYNGDGMSATIAQFNVVAGIAADSYGNLYIADDNNSAIRKVNVSGTISTVAGAFASGTFSGDGGTATAARLNQPRDIALDQSGNFYIADALNNRIRKVNTFDIISTVAGSGNNSSQGYYGDGNKAVSALLYAPCGLAYDTAQNLYIAEYFNHTVRKVNAAGVITTIAGRGPGGGSGVYLDNPSAVTTDRRGNVFVLTANSPFLIEKINSSGIRSNYFTGLSNSSGLTADKSGNLYILENGRVSKIDTGRIKTTIAGTGVPGSFGDGGPATSAQVSGAFGICIDDTGNIYIAEYTRIRKIDTNGIIKTIAGNGSTSPSGDGGPAGLAGLGTIKALTIDKYNNLYFYANSYIRKINTIGIISTVAGKGVDGFSGDEGPATAAALDNRNSRGAGLVVDSSGNILVTQDDNDRIRKVFMATVSITTPTPAICSGSAATFMASGTGLSAYTPVYQWKVNGNNAGTNSTVFTTSALANGDKVSCKVTDGIEGMTIALSDTITMNVAVTAAPSVTVSANPGLLVCAGTAVTCTPTPTIGGTVPVYDWYKNGMYVYTGGTYSFTPVNGDMVHCRLTSNAMCRLADTAISPALTFTVNPTVIPSLTISFSPGTAVCENTRVTCTPNPVNVGSSVAYKWYKNGTQVSSSNTYNFTPVNNDALYCRLISNAACRSSDTAFSATAIFTVAAPVTPSVTITASPAGVLCPSTQVTCTPLPVNAGTVPVYTWFTNGVPVSTGSTYQFTPNDGDKVFCKLTAAGGCFITTDATSNEIAFTVRQLVPSVTFALDPGNTVCEGTAVSATATGINAGTAPVYNWFLNNTSVYTGPVYGFIPGHGDQLYVELTGNDPCAVPAPVSSSSAAFQVFVTPSVTITSSLGPVIFSGTRVTFTAAVAGNGSSYNYQWIRNGHPVPANNTSIYSADDFNTWDSVKCVVTENSMCAGSATSNTLVIDTYHPLKIYPNPNDGGFVINGNDLNVHNSYATITIFNSDGKLVYEKSTFFSNITFYTDIPLGHKLPPGVYNLYISYGAQKVSLPFLVKY